MASASDHTAARTARGFGVELEDDALDADYSMIADDHDDDPEELDYYALLGLSQKPPPTDAEIRSAYRTLSLSFHPDKQPPHLQIAAQRQFTLIQEAYDALIDPQKRMVYDMLGAEGVRQEWGHGGSMGLGGEAQRQEVGVKAMSPDEFQQWFLKVMKKRERKAVDSMVASTGAIIIGVNAQNTIRVDEDADVTIGSFNPKIASFGAKYGFKAPWHLPGFLTKKVDNAETEETDPTQEQSPESNEYEENEDFVDVTFNTGVTGQVVRQKVPYYLSYPDREEDVMVKVNGPRILVATDFHLGASVTPNFRALAGQKGIWGWRPFSLLRDSTVTFEGTLLPERELTTTISRRIQPISGTRPITVTATSSIKYPLLEAPPNFEIQAVKGISSNKMVFCVWSSGSWGWPEFLDRFMFLGMSPDTMCASETDYSKFQIGLVSTPSVHRQMPGDEDVEEDEEDDLNVHAYKQNYDNSRETWQTVLQATPAGGVLALTYGRNLFSGKPTDDPVKSEWSGEGYFPMRAMEQARSVRLEVSTNISQNLAIQWTVQGTRRIGEYTKIGLGVGIAPQGTLMTISWSRLGQQINIPMVICPANEANHDATVLAAVIPWLAYCAIEFGYIRPRDRKRRRQAAALRHKELKKLIPKKRAESAQAIDLMTEQVLRRQSREEKQDGLVITKAEYGYIPSENKKLQSKFPDARLIDVTIPVAALVDRSQLVIPEKRVKFRILGFHDPAPMLPKRLRVWYTFQGREHFVDVEDKEGLACPMRTHLL